jgi:protein-L-isoaspartate(D-aspartate) O-methyltransferase
MTDFSTRRRMMVDTQVRPSDVTEFPIIDALLTGPRVAFVPSEKIEAAYAGEHVELGQGRVVLDPRLFAKMIEALDITKEDLVLDIGAGLGYSSAVIAHIAEAVVAVEDDEARASEAQTLLLDNHVDNVIVHTGALTEGAAAHGAYDVIIVQGGIEQLPEAITDQLKEGGRIVCVFLDGALGTVRVGLKLDGEVTWRFAFNGTAPLLSGFEKAREFAL